MFTELCSEALEQCSGPLRNFRSGSVLGCHGKLNLNLNLAYF